jgi:hypothetical protein
VPLDQRPRQDLADILEFGLDGGEPCECLRSDGRAVADDESGEVRGAPPCERIEFRHRAHPFEGVGAGRFEEPEALRLFGEVDDHERLIGKRR